MKVLFIRHGEPTYDKTAKYGLPGYLGELTIEGMAQAEKVARDPRLSDAELIISSPFTRALQTASFISNYTHLPIKVEPALHEWLADTTHANACNSDYVKNSYIEFLKHNGKREDDCIYNWESVDHIAARAYPVLKSYVGLYDCVIVVAHAMLIRTFGYLEQDMPHCSIYECEINESSQYSGLFVPYIKKDD